MFTRILRWFFKSNGFSLRVNRLEIVDQRLPLWLRMAIVQKTIRRAL